MPSALTVQETVSIRFSTDAAFYSGLRSLGRTLVGLGEQLRAAGKHDEAILYYEATARLGHLMRVDAYWMCDGLVGGAISPMAAGPFLSQKQRDEIRSSSSREESLERQREAYVDAFAAYMQQHRRADLAEFYEQDMQAKRQWIKQIREIIHVQEEMLVWEPLFKGLLNAWTAWLHTAAVLGLWVVVGLLSVGARYRREEPRLLTWCYWQWLLLVGSLAVSWQVVNNWANTQSISVWDADMLFGTETSIASGVGVTAWLALVLIVVLLKRRYQPGHLRMGKARTYLASLRTLLPPTFAAFFLLSVISLWPAHQALQSFNHERRAMIEQGEVQYWGIDEDEERILQGSHFGNEADPSATTPQTE